MGSTVRTSCLDGRTRQATTMGGLRGGAGLAKTGQEGVGSHPDTSAPHGPPACQPALMSGFSSLPESEGMTVPTITALPVGEDQVEISLGEVSKASCPRARQGHSSRGVSWVQGSQSGSEASQQQGLPGPRSVCVRVCVCGGFRTTEESKHAQRWGRGRCQAALHLIPLAGVLGSKSLQVRARLRTSI